MKRTSQRRKIVSSKSSIMQNKFEALNTLEEIENALWNMYSWIDYHEVFSKEAAIPDIHHILI